ncbi:NADPH:quinone oxidoreductase 2 [Labilithrix luteola]|uniref:NADPH:quinone oxidoreductase 2 n=1 Tax=Labilithrix luteola TaxID=1391654 RepID=A0A0K1PQ33_9BACT|nr:NmrA family NAD(P)-binding protein [Labilithrix luteola]AKU95496.1 NADPH:quinone oxidoreductase 2 [Labilithrix luteola]
MTDTILVTGASGRLGRAVVRHLVDTYEIEPTRVIATTRDPAKLSDMTARGIQVRAASFDDPSGLDRAFAGATKVLVISTDELDLEGGKRLRQHVAAVAAAKRAGASYVSYTSMIRPEPGSPVLFANDHFGTEQAIRASGLAFTIFRANSYHENLFLSLPAVFATGRWYTSAGEGRVAYAGRDDMAAAIAACLASPITESTTLDLTGPVAYSNAEVARMVTAVTGRSIEIVPLSDAALTDALKSNGVPEPFARLLASVDANTRMGNSDVESDVLERLLRRKPTSLERFIQANEHGWAL